MIKWLISAVVGACIGGLLGSTRSCKDGGCPLTATPLRGAIYGAVLGSFVGLSLVGSGGAGSRGAGKASEELSPHLIPVHTVEDFEREVVKAKGIVLLDFYADWCGPCQRLLPVISEIADEVAGTARVVKVNVDELGEIAGDYGVSSIPDIRIFVDGKERGRWNGVRSKEFYLQEIASLQAKTPKDMGFSESGEAPVVKEGAAGKSL